MDAPLTTPSLGADRPLSFSQQRLWFLEQLEPNTAVYNITRGLRLRGALDAACLEQALNDLVARHESLRTVFTERDGEPRQVVHAALTLSLPVSTVPTGTEPEAWMRDRLHEVATEPFDLARGPLLRCHLLRLAPDHHVLALVIHHIVSDGWSMGVLARDLSALYQARHRRQPPELPPLPIQYADFAVWQRATLEGPHLKQQLDYWTAQLDGLTELELPTDYRRPLTRDYSGDCRYLSLGPELTAALKTLSQQHNVTLFMTLLAALDVLLYRYTGHTDIAVGTPIAGRLNAKAEHLIGFFVNTLVMRGDCSGNPSFSELLRRVRKTAIDAYAHQELPFEQLVEVLKPSRDFTRNPLFSVVLNYRSTDWRYTRFPGLAAEELAYIGPLSHLPLALYAETGTDSVKLMARFQTRLHTRERIDVLLRHFETLLLRVTRDPSVPIDGLSLLTELEKALYPNITAPLVVDELPVVTELVAAQASMRPDGVAVQSADACLTYAELEHRATAVAVELGQRGLAAGDVVAIHARPGAATVVAMLGVLKARGVFLTIDAALPELRCRMLWRESGARFLIRAGSGAEPSMPGPALELAPDGRLTSRGAGRAVSRPSSAPAPSDSCYVFFTSGSTGTPKAVLGTHRGLSHFLDWQRNQFRVGPGDRVAQIASLSFDVLLREVFLPLTSGGAVVIPSDDDRFGIPAWLEREGITLVHAVPTVVTAWLEDLQAPRKLPALRAFLFSGEPLLGSLIDRLRERLRGDYTVINMYGPTETTMIKSWYEIPGTPRAGSQPIGRALPGCQMFVLTPQLTPCAIGERGEIVLRTPYRTRGYLNAPEAQARSFVQNPYTSDPEDQLYRTGDAGHVCTDGSVELHGRIDNEVKINGVRVDPDEVTATLLMHPSIGAGVVIAMRNESDANQLVAYYELGKLPPHRDELREFLRRRLPAPLVPAVFVPIDKLPRLPNGKLDRRALPAPEPPAAVDIPLVSDPLQQRVAAIWRELLGCGPIAAGSNFFDLGGHSLLAMRAVARIRRSLNTIVTVRDLLEHQSLEAFAARLAEIGCGAMPADHGKRGS